MKLFEDLPSQNMPITAENLNQIQDNLVVVSATEPEGNSREKVWIQQGKNLVDIIFSQGSYNDTSEPARVYYYGNYKVKAGTTYVLHTNLSNEYQVAVGISNKAFPVDTIEDLIYDSGWNTGKTAITFTAIQDGYLGVGCKKIGDYRSITPANISSYSFQLDIEPKIYVKNDDEVYEEFISKDNLVNYSTQEQKIGTWINGKPIYRKLIKIDAFPNASLSYVNHNIENIDEIIRIYGKATDNTSELKTTLELPYVNPLSESIGIGIHCNTSNITIRAGDDRSNYSGYAIIEYTKTTD